MKRYALLLILLLAGMGIGAQEKTLVSGMKIKATTKIKKGVYRINAPADTAMTVILIEGNNIVVDFNNAELRGSNDKKNPDAFTGIAILVRNSKNVTIKNLKARGYKVAFTARNTEQLSVENCDFSYNYRQHLNSTQEKEDISDWMSYHHNEKDEWLRYGAGMYLKDCNFFTVKSCTVTGGQNALMMMRCEDGLIVNNDFSFNSGIGIGMYRSNRNKVGYNRIIFNVRGYSHEIYNRGQDSAGILVYEQSSNNIFYKNNVTHSGDGFFLWAGQTTMDSGIGGCNDNIIDGNDFSYAPTNGVEVTFSRVRVTGNRIYDCDYGIWGGYSYSSVFSGNKLRNNRIGIAIEHGQYNEISDNIFYGDREAVKLWARKVQPADWGYAKYRDTRSVGYTIAGNSFNSNPVVYNLSRTDSISIYSNAQTGYGALLQADSTVTNLDSVVIERFDTGALAPLTVINPKDPFTGTGKYAGRKNIRMTEWGPYDFRYPLIWNTNPLEKADTMRFEILGPPGVWKIVGSTGVTGISKSSGNIPASFSVLKDTAERTDISIKVEYTGQSFTDPFGNNISRGKKYRFGFRKFFQPVEWEVLFYHLDTSYYNPLKTGSLFSMTERKAPFKTDRTDKIDYAWWGGIKEAGIQHNQFITSASGHTVFNPGEYELSVTWDDAVRVYVDEKLVLNEWNPSLYTFDESPNKKVRVRLGGEHHFRVEHLELGGFATLALKIRPVE